MNLGIVGSRTFQDYELLCSVLNEYKINKIVSGGAIGADSLAIKYAQEKNIAFVEFLPDWNKYGKYAGFQRDELIVSNSDKLVAFWDGKSKGTKHSIDLAKKQGKEIRIVRV